MAGNDGAGLTDALTAELFKRGQADRDFAAMVENFHRDFVRQPDPQVPAIPPRPRRSDLKSEWVAYVVALGMHPAAAEDRTVAELIDLAEKFGG